MSIAKATLSSGPNSEAKLSTLFNTISVSMLLTGYRGGGQGRTEARAAKIKAGGEHGGGLSIYGGCQFLNSFLFIPRARQRDIGTPVPDALAVGSLDESIGGRPARDHT